MYPWEIEQFLKERNYYIGGDDLSYITNIKNHPQLKHIEYNPYENKYKMWDGEGNYYSFTPMPYKEALEKGLVKDKYKKEDDFER